MRGPRNVDDDVHDEVDFHIQMRIRDNLRAGMSPAEARREAERRFGDRARVEGEVRRLAEGQLRRTRRREWFGGLWRDVRLGVRNLRRRPGFAAAVILTLALGIGATTAIFSVAEWAILRPLPGVGGPEELFTVRFEREETAGQGLGFAFISHADASDLTSAPAPAVGGLTSSAFNQAHVVLPGGGTPERRGVEVVMPGYFHVLGVSPALGRTPEPLPGEDPRIVMLGHRFWQEALGGAPSVIGSTLEFNGHPFTVVGVAPREFRGASYPMSRVDAWIPIPGWATVGAEPDATLLTARNRGFFLNLYGRLSPGALPSAAESQLRAARRALVEASPGASRLEQFVPVVTAGVGLAPWVKERITGMLTVLGGVVVLLLVLAVANAANLVLARGHARRHELAVRRAIGAGRGHLVRQLVTEGMVLGATAGMVGVGLAGTLLAIFHGQRLGRNLPPLEGVTLDGRVLAFAAGTALLTGILFSVVPALLAARATDGSLRSGTRTVGGDGRLRGALVVVQVALSMGLLAGSGLLLDSLRALGDMELGFEATGVAEMTLDPRTQGYGSEALPALWRDLLASVRAAPGVQGAGFAGAALHGNQRADTRLRPAGTPAGEEGVDANTNQVSEGYIAALGIDLLAGRDFLPAEVMADPPRNVLLVSRDVAQRLAPGGNALGMEVELTYREGIFRIVGIVGDVRMHSAKDKERALVLEPIGQQWTPSWGTIYARSGGSAAALARRLPDAVARVDPALPAYDVMTLEERVSTSLTEDRMLARLTTLFAALAVLLAGVGLYAVMAYSVAARTREFGVRLALGAGAGGIREMVLRQGLKRTGLGILAGLGVAYAVGRLLANRLWGVVPADPWVLATAAATLLVVGALASWLPAWRATRVNPIRALRAE